MSIKRRTCDDEYADNARINKADIEQILQWLEKQPHLPMLTEYMAIQFYDSSLHSSQRAKELIETHFEFRNEAPEFFTGLDYPTPKYNHSFWDTAYCTDLPIKTPEGYKIIYCGFKDPDPSKFNFEIALAMFTKIMISVIMTTGACSGYAFVFDIKGIVLSHFATVTISLVKKYLYFVQEAIPLKVKAVHIINVHSIIDKIMLLAKPFLKKELYDMVYIQSDMNKFYKTVTKEAIPIDVGGTLPYTREELSNRRREKLLELEESVEKELQRRLDESKRLVCKRNECKLKSMNGSFKKLAID